MKRGTLLISMLALLAATLPARSEDPADYPSRKIRMLLPFSAGGGGDVLGNAGIVAGNQEIHPQLLRALKAVKA